MARFEIKETLPAETQAELTRIEAISSGLRTTGESNFLTALDPYRENRVLRWDVTGIASAQNPRPYVPATDDILEAEGNTLPTGYAGFKQGAIFYDLDKTERNAYVNTGDN